jgi:2-dehydropantoate 2-reductase
MQNGISHLDLQALTRSSPTAYGTTTEGATLLGKGHVRHAGSGTTFLGMLGNQENEAACHPQLLATKKMLERSGLNVQITDNILSRIWAKLFINVGINALTATLNCPNGELLTRNGVSLRMTQAVQEAQAVAEAQDIELVGDPVTMTRDVAEKTALNISSMLQDVRNARRTEIDAINGAISAMGAELGIPTPENRRLYREIKEIEATYDKQ